jgi:hypothetical protein
MYLFLGRTSAPDVAAREGIDVTGSGASMTATPRNMGKARESLRNHMKQFVLGLGRQ